MIISILLQRKPCGEYLHFSSEEQLKNYRHYDGCIMRGGHIPDNERKPLKMSEWIRTDVTTEMRYKALKGSWHIQSSMSFDRAIERGLVDI